MMKRFCSRPLSSLSFSKSRLLALAFLPALAWFSPLQAAHINFSTAAISGYDAGQDAGTHTVTSSGAGIALNGNAWKKIAFPYTVTSKTVIEFEFRSTQQGEIHGIGFDTDNIQAPGYLIQIGGTDVSGLQGYKNYSGTGWKHYVIPVGKFYTGAMNYLFFTNDQDVATPTAQGEFRNVQVYDTGKEWLDFDSHPVSAFDQDAGTASVLDSGRRLALNGNAWKKINLPYVVTADTVLEFDFIGTVQGEVHGIGFETDNVLTENYFFELWGTQTFARQNYRDFSGTLWTHYTIPVGQFYTGAMKHLVFANDHDVTTPNAHGEFRNIQIYENKAAFSVTQSDQFVDSIGVGTMAWEGRSEAYGTVVRDKMVGLGVRHARDYLTLDQPEGTATWQMLRDAGLRMCFATTLNYGTAWTTKSYLINNGLVGFTEYLEGPNEPSRNDSDWAAQTKSWCINLYNAFRGDAATAHIPFAAPSLAMNVPDMTPIHTAVGDLSGYTEYGNSHPYPGGALPTSKLVSAMNLSPINVKTRPMLVTETGYHNGTTLTTGHNPASETATALYLPRLYLEYFAAGVERTYWFSLLDNFTPAQAAAMGKPIEAHFGLVRYDFTEKPAYHALKNLITIMKDPGTPFAPTPATVTVSGSADVKSLLFQRRDGKYQLAVWRNVSVWNVASRQNVTPANATITVTFPNQRPQVQVFFPTTSATAANTYTNRTSLQIPLAGQVAIVRF